MWYYLRINKSISHSKKKKRRDDATLRYLEGKREKE